MKPLDIINEFYESGTDLYTMLLVHSEKVIRKALEVADRMDRLQPDRQFIKEAAMLHDIGIYRTDAPHLCCYGSEPYLRHGVLGREILEAKGLPRHALVCERHVGVGITADDIRKNSLPLPARNMIPETIEERIIAYADKFYSKDCRTVVETHDVEWIVNGLKKHGEEKAATFREWVREFDGDADGTG